jgi:hypothetical protein
MRGALLFLVLLAACGPKTAPSKAVVSNVPVDGGAGANPATCPESWGEANGACDPAVATVGCTFPEGSCYCGVTPVCSGMRRPDDWYDNQPKSWQCTANPPEVRADGCPGTEPSGACASEGLVCNYGDCCFQQLTCQSGQWTTTGGGCPP